MAFITIENHKKHHKRAGTEFFFVKNVIFWYNGRYKTKVYCSFGDVSK